MVLWLRKLIVLRNCVIANFLPSASEKKRNTKIVSRISIFQVCCPEFAIICHSSSVERQKNNNDNCPPSINALCCCPLVFYALYKRNWKPFKAELEIVLLLFMLLLKLCSSFSPSAFSNQNTMPRKNWKEGCSKYGTKLKVKGDGSDWTMNMINMLVWCCKSVASVNFIFNQHRN